MKVKKQKKSTFSWLMEFASPHKTNYIISIVFAILGVACSMIPYWFVAQIVINLIDQNTNLSFYLKKCFIMALLWILRYVFHALSTTLSHSSTFAVISEVRLKLSDKLTKLPMGYVLDIPSGSLKNIIVEKSMSMETTLAHLVPELSSSLLVSISIIIYLFFIDWKMALVSLITIPIGLLCYCGMMNGYEERYSNYVTKNRHLNDTTVEYINGIEVIKAFSQSASSYEKFTTAVKESTAAAVDWMSSCQKYFTGAMSIFPAVLVGVLPIGCIFYMNGSLTADNFIMAIVLSLGIMPPLLTAMSYTDALSKISTIVNQIAEILLKPDMVRPDAKKEMKNYDISLENVSFSYGKEMVLRNINLEIKEGQVTALVGLSGSGKSTIAKLIASLWDVTEGSISIGGINTKNMPLSQINDIIAYVSQDNYLFNDTIRNNIRMGNLKATDEEVEEASKRSGCHDFIMSLEKGYETQVGSGGGHLSGGERQRITIARAMLKNAPIVIMDEATAYTDPESEAIIQSSVSKLITGKTLIVIAHRLSTITDSDKIVVINEGTIDAEGNHEFLLKNCKLYKNMWIAYNSAKDGTGESNDSDI